MVIVWMADHLSDDKEEDEDVELTEVIVWIAHHIDSGMEVYNSLESFSTK